MTTYTPNAIDTEATLSTFIERQRALAHTDNPIHNLIGGDNVASERATLLELAQGGPTSMSVLGARIRLSRAAITTLTDRLEAKGLVHRVPDPKDRRRTYIELADGVRNTLLEAVTFQVPA